MTGLHWDHNAHYHRLILDAVPPGAGRALDVGCGEGRLAVRLAERCDQVVAVDQDAGMVAAARGRVPATVTVVQGDALTVPRPSEGFDVITCVASLHHLGRQVGLERAVKELRGLLAPGGTLVVLGLYGVGGPVDLLQYAIARPADLAVGLWRRIRLGGDRADEHGADMPVARPDVTLPELRRAAAELVPGATVRRLLFWRYLLVFTEPRP